MDVDRPIRSRKPLRYVGNDSHSPHGSPNTPRRRDFRQKSPDYSGSDNKYALEGMSYDYDSDKDVSSSTVNSSLDAPDGHLIMASHDYEKKKYDTHGRLREYSRTRDIRKVVIKPEATPNNNLLWIPVLLVFIMLSVVCFKHISNDQIGHTAIERKVCSFDVYQERFPNQDKLLWKSLQQGVENVLNNVPVSPSIFLLAYKDIATANIITQMIVRKTTECMQSKVNAVELTSDDLNSDEMRRDYGIVITKYKSRLARSGVMLVNDLNKVPAEVAPAFHTFCDVHNPLVDRSVIFLTVHLDDQYNSLIPHHSTSYTKTLQTVENYLRSNWSELERNTLDPLITRVTDQVFLINKE